MHKPKPVGRPFISGCDGPTEQISAFVDTSYGTDLARDLFSSRIILDCCLPLLRDKGVILLQNSPWCCEFMEASMQMTYIPLLLSDVTMFLWFLYSFHAASLGFRAWSLDNRLRCEIWRCISGVIHGNWSPHIRFFLNWRMIMNLIEKCRSVIPHVIHIGGEHSGVQRRKIKKWIYFGRKNPLQTYFQYRDFNSHRPPDVKNGFIKGEALRLHRTNSSKKNLRRPLGKSKRRLRPRGYPKTIIERSLSGANFVAKPSPLRETKKANERILSFATTFYPAVRNLKQTLME